MDVLKKRVLQLFGHMQKEVLDLHVLFEAGGNEPQERERVLDAIKELTGEGLVQPAGNDFYTLTEKGKRALVASNGRA